MKFRVLAILAVALMGIGVPAARAQDATPGAFTFKRIGPPKANAPSRLVQIDPDAPQYFATPQRDPRAPRMSDNAVSEAADGAPNAVVQATDLPFPGFWQKVSPHIRDADAARLDAVLAELVRTNVSGTDAQGFALMADLAVRYGEMIEETTDGTQVSPALVLSVMAVESAGRADAVSSAGAAGLMQLMPATAERFGVTDAKVPEQGIKGGVAYLDWLLGHFHADPVLTLSAYNAGEGAVARNKGVPPFAETRAYVPKVLGAWRAARLLCSPRPNHVTDVCKLARPRAAAAENVTPAKGG